MGKKKKIARYPQKFGKKYGAHPIAKSKPSNPVAAVMESVVEAVESAVEAVVEAVVPDPVVEEVEVVADPAPAPKKPAKKRGILKSKSSKG